MRKVFLFIAFSDLFFSLSVSVFPVSHRMKARVAPPSAKISSFTRLAHACSFSTISNNLCSYDVSMTLQNNRQGSTEW